MQKISDAFGQKTVSLPSYPGSKVVLKNKLTVGDLEEIEAVEGDYKRGLLMASKMILSWDFEEPITVETIKQLPAEDLETIISNIAIQKKN